MTERQITTRATSYVVAVLAAMWIAAIGGLVSWRNSQSQSTAAVSNQSDSRAVAVDPAPEARQPLPLPSGVGVSSQGKE